jgi:hypothetical protein
MKTQFSISVSSDQKKYIDAMARSHYISKSQAIRQLLQLGIDFMRTQEPTEEQELNELDKKLIEAKEYIERLSYQRDVLKGRLVP